MAYLALSLTCAIWVLLDGLSRRAKVLPWVLGVAMAGPILLPVYLARRPLRTGEIREGGVAWNILKNFVILWTLLMLVVAISVAAKLGDLSNSLAFVATTLSLGMIAGIWFFPFVAAVGIAFLVKKSSIIEEGPIGQLAAQPNRAPIFASRWIPWAVTATVWLVLIAGTIALKAYKSYSARARHIDTPLVHAALAGDVNTVRRLIKEGADINDGLALAATHGHKDALKVLLANGADLNASLVRAAKRRDPVEMEALLANGADVDAKDEEERPLLCSLVINAKSEVIEVLLRHEANIEVKDKFSHTPLMTAVFWGNVEGVETLLRYGADVDARDYGQGTGDTALTYAALFCPSKPNQLKAIQLLLEHGADVNARGALGTTAAEITLSRVRSGMCSVQEGATLLALLRPYGAR